MLFALSQVEPPRPRGFFLGTFLTLYGVFRILIEFVRLPDVQIGYFFGTWGRWGNCLASHGRRRHLPDRVELRAKAPRNGACPPTRRKIHRYTNTGGVLEYWSIQ